MTLVSVVSRWIIVFATCLGIAACAPEPEPIYYLLDQASSESPETTSQASGRLLIGVREISLPLYARRTQIATLGADNAISLSELNRWAEDPPRAASRVVARTLSEVTGGESVIEPWATDLKIDYRVDIEVDYFAGSLGGQLRLEGQYLIFTMGGASEATSFSIQETVPESDYDALVRSHTRALERLALDIGGKLR